MSKQSVRQVFTAGLLRENPVLRLVLGTCPTLAVTTAAVNGLGMGVAATVVLVCSNLVISALRKLIPDKVRIPAFITVIAGFVSVVQLLVKAYAPAIDSALGIYLPLIVVNCIILGRAEMFASKNPVLPSILDGLGMGIGFTCTLVVMGAIRELIGTGCLFGLPVTAHFLPPMLIAILPPGGFFVFGVLVALSNKLAERAGKPAVDAVGCEGCSMDCAGCGTPCDSRASGTEDRILDAPQAETGAETGAKAETPPAAAAGTVDRKEAAQ